MPTPKEGRDSRLLDLFLSVYDDGTWANGLSDKDRPESRADGGVDKAATRKLDGLRLAIEHTLIEPFEGEKTDFHKHFKSLQAALRTDDTLRVPGFALYLNVPVRVVPHKKHLQGIIHDIAEWMRKEHPSFDGSQRNCPCPNHPDGFLMLWARREPLPRHPLASFVIVHRYGEMRVDQTVEKALRDKLPKLTGTQADRRLLMLERDQGWLEPNAIYAEVERLRPHFAALAAVDEIWIMDTASFEDGDRYVAFFRTDAVTGRNIEKFEFYDRTLFARFKKGMPVYTALPGAQTPPP
jgi:hypothetical protein